MLVSSCMTIQGFYYIWISQVELHELKEKESSLSTFPTSELAVLAGVSNTQKLPGISDISVNVIDNLALHIFYVSQKMQNRLNKSNPQHSL